MKQTGLKSIVLVQAGNSQTCAIKDFENVGLNLLLLNVTKYSSTVDVWEVWRVMQFDYLLLYYSNKLS